MYKNGIKISQFVDNGKTLSLHELEGSLVGDLKVKTIDITHRSNEIFKNGESSFAEKDLAICKWLHSEDVEDAAEKMIIADSGGNIISISDGVLGSVGFINSKNEIKAFRKAKKRSLVTYHNHHWSSNFSEEDIEVLMKQSKIKESVVVCNNKKIYRLSCDKIFDNLENNVIIEYDKYYKLYNGNEKKVVQKLCEIFGLKYSEGDM